jgi:hypothetical protein
MVILMKWLKRTQELQKRNEQLGAVQEIGVEITAQLNSNSAVDC